MSLLRQEVREIAGREYTIRVLNVEDSRKVLPKAQRVFPFIIAADKDADDGGADLGGLFLAGLNGAVSEDDLAVFTRTFARYTTVEVRNQDPKAEGNVVLRLDSTNRNLIDELFAGETETLYAWLEACIEINFGGMVAKMKAAFARKSEGKAPSPRSPTE